MATLEAVQRRRDARKLRHLRGKRKPLDSSFVRACRLAARARDIELAARLCRKFFNGESPGEHDIRSEIQYWRLRRCGWDVLKPKLRTLHHPHGGTTLCDPWQSPVWLWWCQLHHQQRAEIITLTRRSVPAQAM